MKNIFFFLICSLFFSAVTNAQQIQVGPVLGLEIPVGGFSDGYSIGAAFGASGKYFLNDKMAVGGNLIYNSFHGDKPYGGDYYYDNNWHNKAGITAFTGLFEYYFYTNDKLKLYAGGDLGLYFWREKWNYYYTWTNPGGNVVQEYHEGINSGTDLGIAPMAGVTYDISNKLVLNGNMKFNLMITNSGLNFMGFNFGLFYKIDK